jgi:amidohydrolase
MMQIDIKEEFSKIAEEILSIRRNIHMFPELGNNEYKTAEIVEKELKKAGIPIHRVLDTGVVGVIKGAYPGKTIAFRADMDALPVDEKTGSEFSSRIPGMMHACGHDVHTAALIAAARVIADHRNEMRGSAVFIFQPDEEGDGGAARLIKIGALKGANAVFGAHVSPDIPAGTVGIRFGDFYAAADTFDVRIIGKGAHAAEREKGADALAAGAKMTSRLLRIPHALSDGKSVLTVGTFHSGNARNILADEAMITGIVRTHGQAEREKIKESFYRIVAETDKEYSTETEVRYVRGYPGICNEDAMTSLVENAAIKLIGKENVIRISSPTMMTEDFGCYLNELPGSFYYVGAGCDMPLHSSEFLPADEAVLTTAAVHVAVAAAFLK